MSAMSKTAIPFICYVLYSTILRTCTLVLVLKQNAVFWKQVRSSIFLCILKQKHFGMHIDSSSVVHSHQQKNLTFVRKRKLNSNRLQRFNNHSGLALPKWIAENGVATIFLKGLQECHVKTDYKMELLEMSVLPLKNLPKVLEPLKPMISGPLFPEMPPEIRFAKNQQKVRIFVLKVELVSMKFQNVRYCNGLELLQRIAENVVRDPTIFSKATQKHRAETGYKIGPLNMTVVKLKNTSEVLDFLKPAISFTFFLLMTPETKRCAEDFEDFHKSPKKPMSTTRDDTESPTVKSHLQDQMKLLGMCFVCKEKISKKKFFDERRFGILSRCDCMICYGCIRKAKGTSGVVRGPVYCPSCSVESGIIAASARWIKSEEKLKFFEIYSINSKRWEDSDIMKDFCTRGQRCV